MKKRVYLLTLILILLSANLAGQNIIEEYEGIPTKISIGVSDHLDSDFHLLDELGFFSLTENTMTLTEHNYIRDNTNLKVIPYNWTIVNNDIIEISSGHYSKWYAADWKDDTYSFYAVPGYGEVYNDGDIDIVKNVQGTKNNPFLIGPGCNFENIRRNGIEQFYTTNQLNLRCKIVKGNGTSIDEKIMKIAIKFRSESTGDYITIKNIYILNSSAITFGSYTTLNLGELILNPDLFPEPNSVDDDDLIDASYQQNVYIEATSRAKGIKHKIYPNVRFEFTMASENYEVFIDYLEIADDIWNQSNSLARNKQRIKTQLEEHPEYVASNTPIAGWFTADEPMVFNNYFPQRKVIEYIDSYYDGKISGETTVCVGWLNFRNSYYSEIPGQNKHIFEPAVYKEQANPRVVWINQYPYDYPKKGIENIESNINQMHTLYKEVSKIEEDFAFSIQTYGDEKLNDNSLFVERNRFPEDNEIVYQMFSGLLYGAKTIGMWCLRSYSNASTKMYGLLDETGNWRRASLYSTMKDDILAPLNGEFGQTLKTLELTENIDINHEVRNINEASYNTNVGFTSIHHADITTAVANVDISKFTDNNSPNSTCFMIVSRPYNSTDISNYQVVWESEDEFVDLIPYEYYHETPLDFQLLTDRKIRFNFNMAPGYGVLVGFEPIYKLGGRITEDGNVARDAELRAPLTIAAFKSLTVSAEYTLNADITLEAGAFIERGVGGRITLENNARIHAYSYANSLIASKTGTAIPLLIKADITATYYREVVLQRKFESGSWTDLCPFSDNTYTDTGVNIYENGGTSSVQYRIRYETYWNANHYSNIVEYSIGNIGIEKTGEVIPTEYGLSQNYPNPFNPNTTIQFDLPQNSDVEITLYNSLGQQVKTIANRYYSAGYQSVNFNGSELASGMYIYQIKAIGENGKEFTESKKMVLMK